jgi:hypothetical protein
MRIVILTLVGALSGAIISVIWGPTMLRYWATPPFHIPGCDYEPAITWAMRYLEITQGLCILAGAILVPVLFGLVFRRRRKAEAA